jgi:hypothetical protein
VSHFDPIGPVHRGTVAVSSPNASVRGVFPGQFSIGLISAFAAEKCGGWSTSERIRK